MTIHGIRPRMTEIGRLRMGEKSDKDYPTQLANWRLTSSHLDAMAEAARLFGGTVGEWSEGHGTQYELVTESPALEVLVPPQDLEAGQYLEAYGGGGVVRRCDGIRELLSGSECLCAAEGEQSCKPTTHLVVFLEELPGLGVWRLTTRGFNAASELAGAIRIVDSIRTSYGVDLVRARLIIEPREKIAGAQTRHFVVPVLSLPYSLAEAGSLASSSMARSSLPEIASVDAEPAAEPGALAAGPTSGSEASDDLGHVAAGTEYEPDSEPAAPEGNLAPDPEASSLPRAGSVPAEPSGRRWPNVASRCLHTEVLTRLLGEDFDRCSGCGTPASRFLGAAS